MLLRSRQDKVAAVAVLLVSVACALGTFAYLHHPAPAAPDASASADEGDDARPAQGKIIAAAKSLVILDGGTYSGAWSSDDPKTPAILIKTAEPVVIENSTLRGRGDLIATGVDHANVTVRNTRGVGLNPNVAGRAPGRFFTAENCDTATIENCELTHTAGIYFLGFGGDRELGHATIRLLRNRARNIDGRKSDGKGGWLDFNTRRPRAGGGAAEDGFVDVQFLALDKVRHVPGIEVAWNEVVNDPFDSRVEDNINVFLSSGTRDAPIRIHDNFVRGAYTIRPNQADRHDEKYDYDWSYSGGGIMLGDGKASLPDDVPAFVEAYDNQVVATTNYGIAICAGHDSVFDHNRVVSSGLLPEGLPAAGQAASGKPIAAQNVGVGVWDGYGGAAQVPPTFFNNWGHDNVVGWNKADARNDWWHPDAFDWKDNAHLDGPITRETEQDEWMTWNRKLLKAHIAIGVRMNPAPPPAPDPERE